MKFIEKYNQHRRDCDCLLKCENCEKEEEYKNAYDDDNFWQHVIPAHKCPNCGKSTRDLCIEPEKVITRYLEREVH